MLQIVTSAVYAISTKSIFARAVIGSPGVVTNSINITAVCSVGALVDVSNKKKSLTRAEYDYVATFVYHDTGISCVGSFISNSLLTGKHF